MAKSRISWGKIRAGDVVEFRYKGQKLGAKSRYRTALILNERHMYKRVDGHRVRLVHAMEFSAIPRRSGSVILREAHIKKLLKKAGKVELREGADSDYFAIKGTRMTAKRQYNKLRNLVTQHANYRTYSWARLKTRACFISEDFQWPDELVKDVLENARDPEIDEAEL
jgi:hypothetical protein